MSTQYPPSSQPSSDPDQPSHGGPAPQSEGADPVSILGLVFAFLFWPVGLILSLIGISRTGKGKRPGRGLAIAGTIISAIAGVIVVIVIVAIAGAASQASDDVDAAVVQFEEDMAELESSATADPTAEEESPAEGATAGEAAPDEAPAEAAVSLGQPATVENITFTVTSETCGETSVGDEFLSVDAQGVFCMFDVTVQNGSTEPLFFDSSSVTGYLGEAEYSADGEAAIYLEDNDAFLEEINPGNTVEATIVFDVPAGAQLDRLELSPGLFASERAVVTLR